MGLCNTPALRKTEYIFDFLENDVDFSLEKLIEGCQSLLLSRHSAMRL